MHGHLNVYVCPYMAGETIEAILEDEDNNDENFDCGYCLDNMSHSEKGKDSESNDLHMQIEGLILQKSNKAIDNKAISFTGKNCNKMTL